MKTNDKPFRFSNPVRLLLGLLSLAAVVAEIVAILRHSGTPLFVVLVVVAIGLARLVWLR